MSSLFLFERELWGSVIFAIALLLTVAGTFRFASANPQIRISTASKLSLILVSLALAVFATILIDRYTTEDVCIYVILGLWMIAAISGAIALVARHGELRRNAVAIALAIATAEVLTIPQLLLGGQAWF